MTPPGPPREGNGTKFRAVRPPRGNGTGHAVYFKYPLHFRQGCVRLIFSYNLMTLFNPTREDSLSLACRPASSTQGRGCTHVWGCLETFSKSGYFSTRRTIFASPRTIIDRYAPPPDTPGKLAQCHPCDAKPVGGSAQRRRGSVSSTNQNFPDRTANALHI